MWGVMVGVVVLTNAVDGNDGVHFQFSRSSSSINMSSTLRRGGFPP